MTIPTNPINLFTPFLPSTFNMPDEEGRRVEWLGSTFSGISDVVNSKKIGSYTHSAINFNGEEWIFIKNKVRNGYQIILYIASLPNADTLIIPNPIIDINPQFVITLTYGTASKPCTSTGAGDGDYLTFMNRGDPRIFWDMSDTTITITTTIDLSLYSGFLVIHFLRDGQ